MINVLEMPKLTDTMVEGIITRWLVQEGDRVTSGEELLEIETDKANVVYESFENGFLKKIIVSSGKSAALGQPIAIITEGKDEDISSFLENMELDKETVPSLNRKAKKDHTEELSYSDESGKTSLTEMKKVTGEIKRALISPIAKKIAGEKRIDINQLHGTGPGGRIIKRDVLQYLEQTGTETKILEYEDIPLSMMRKTIATRMVEAKSSIPHYYLTLTCDLSLLSNMRKKLIETLPKEDKISFNIIFIKIAAVALLKYPVVNSSFQGNFIRQYKIANISFAVALEKGLLVPTLLHVEQKGLNQINKEFNNLIQKAKTGKLSPEEMTGGTFCLTNLGMYNIEEFSAVINPPQAAILALGKIEEAPLVNQGEIKIVPKMKATLSCDHRVIDGKEGAEFLNYFKYLIENPLGLVY